MAILEYETSVAPRENKVACRPDHEEPLVGALRRREPTAADELVAQQPSCLYVSYIYDRQLFDDEVAMERFLREVCTPAWNAEQDRGRSWADAVRRFWFLAAFDGVVVSGEEGVCKPDPEIFHRLARRFDLVPGGRCSSMTSRPTWPPPRRWGSAATASRRQTGCGPTSTPSACSPES